MTSSVVPRLATTTDDIRASEQLDGVMRMPDDNTALPVNLKACDVHGFRRRRKRFEQKVRLPQVTTRDPSASHPHGVAGAR